MAVQRPSNIFATLIRISLCLSLKAAAPCCRDFNSAEARSLPPLGLSVKDVRSCALLSRYVASGRLGLFCQCISSSVFPVSLLLRRSRDDTDNYVSCLHQSSSSTAVIGCPPRNELQLDRHQHMRPEKIMVCAIRVPFLSW